MPGCSGDCHEPFDGMSDDYKRRLIAVIAINGSMFFIEFYFGLFAQSQALMADALDFFADTITYTISILVIGASIRYRAMVAMFKGTSLAIMGITVMGLTLYRTIFQVLPEAHIMGWVAVLALAANLASLLLLITYKDGDANVRSVWLCTCNDAIGNVLVMLAALGVWGTATGWPDLLTAMFMASLFLWSSWQILHQARDEWNSTKATV